jgi:hypothetical protein
MIGKLEMARMETPNSTDGLAWRVWERIQEGCPPVRAARELREMTVADLSVNSGIAAEQIEAFEAGIAFPSEAEATMIARACAVPRDLLVQ